MRTYETQSDFDLRRTLLIFRQFELLLPVPVQFLRCRVEVVRCQSTHDVLNDDSSLIPARVSCFNDSGVGDLQQTKEKSVRRSQQGTESGRRTG